MPSLRSTRRSGRMAATGGAKEVMLHGGAAATARAEDRERLKQRAVLGLRQAGYEGGRSVAQVARHLKVTERLARGMLSELTGAGLVEAVPGEEGRYRLTERGVSVKWRKNKGPTRTMRVLGHNLDARQTALVSRLLTARSWVRISELNRTQKGAGKQAQALAAMGVTQLDSQGRVALTRAAFQELSGN